MTVRGWVETPGSSDFTTRFSGDANQTDRFQKGRQHVALSESDTRAKLIDPAIHARGWTEDLIKREETAGAILIVDGRPRKQTRGRVDYVLRVKVNSIAQPVAVGLIEAKAEDLPPTHGLEQAKAYCKRLNVPFVFSSNGHLYVEFDSVTGQTSSPRPIHEFPSPHELRGRYESAKGVRLDDEAAKPLLVPYKGGEATRRYYQDAAIRAALEKIALCAKTGEPARALLALATGSGKTFIAVHLLRRIADAGQLRRALFVCDRDELRAQGLGAFQNAFGSDAAPVSGANPQKNARILIATYQTLDIDSYDADANFLITHYPENYFSHIVIDECHRSAWGKWSLVLKRNPDAVQIGLTATPRHFPIKAASAEAKADEGIIADNLQYFGEPVYEYDMSQGIEDGYLAACEIVKGRVNLDETGISVEDVLARHPKNALTGEPMDPEQVRERYEKTSFENRILLPDRVAAMTEDLFMYLLGSGGPEQKSIIFCVGDRHADEVAIAMNNLYGAWCAKNGHRPVEAYAFKCTAMSSGNDYLPDFRGSSAHHFIATTVDLLTTGVDVPCVQNIVFFKYVRSPIAFYQMVGRGTRLHPPTGKLMFRVYDYTNATSLFGEEFIGKPPRTREPGPEPPEPPEPVIVVEGFEVRVTPAGRYIVTEVDGKAMPVTVEEYRERVAESLVQEAPTLDHFRSVWVEPERRRDLLSELPDAGRSAVVVQTVDGKQEYDLYDVLAELGYGLAGRTRADRAEAFTYKNTDWLSRLPSDTAKVIAAIASQFARAGTEGLESQYIFQTPEVAQAGGLAALQAAGEPRELLYQTKVRMFTG